MATQVIDLGAAPFGSSNQGAWDGAVALDAALIASGAAAYLRYIDNVAGSPRIRLAADAVADPQGAGPEFTAAFESAAMAFTFAEAGGDSVTLKGPQHADNTFRDATEPYFWTPDNTAAWSAWVLGLGGGDVTLTLDDDVVAYSFYDAAVVAGSGDPDVPDSTPGCKLAHDSRPTGATQPINGAAGRVAGQRLPPGDVEGVDNAFVVLLALRPGTNLRFRLDVSATGSGSGAGPQLADAADAAYGIALRAHDGAAAKIAVSDAVALDADEPYDWNWDDGDAGFPSDADWTALRNAFLAGGGQVVIVDRTHPNVDWDNLQFGRVMPFQDAAVAPIVSGLPVLAAAAERVDGVTHDAAAAPIVSGLPALAAVAERVDAVTHDAVVAPLASGAPDLTAAAMLVDGVANDGALGAVVSGIPALSVAAEVVPAPAFEGFLAPDGDRVLTGAAAAAQRLADALRIQRGSYPFLRDYGSTLGQIVDQRPEAAFAAVAEALIHPANGLDDIELRAVRVSPAGAGAVVVEVDAGWRPAPAAASTPISIREQLQPGS